MSTSLMQQKVSKVLSSRVRVDSPDMTAALNGLSTLYTENTLANRRQLRSLLERRTVAINTALVAAFQSVHTELGALTSTINQLQSAAGEVAAKLAEAKKTNAVLIQETNQLQTQRAAVDSRHELVSSFLDKFQLSAADIKALDTASSDEMTDEFFVALNRIGTIRRDCKTLLHTHHQRVGLDIMDSLGKRLTSGFEKLVGWVQTEVRRTNTTNSISTAANPEINPTLIRALYTLRHMPFHYDHCCQEILQARRLLLVRRFIDALTRGSGPSPRPMELHAHDPIRFVSDMLAWLHQAVASERDVLVSLTTVPANATGTGAANGSLVLLDEEEEQKQQSTAAAAAAASGETKDSAPASAASNGPSTPAMSVDTMLGQVFEGVCRPLQTRIEQALTLHSSTSSSSAGARAASPTAAASAASPTNPYGSLNYTSASASAAASASVISYKLGNVLLFYLQTLGSRFPESSSFRQTLVNCNEAAKTIFLELVRKQSEKLITAPPNYTHDLSPARQITDTINQLSEIMSAYSSSLVAAAQRDADFAPVLAEFVDPIIKSLSLSTASTDLDPNDTATYHINSLTALTAALRKPYCQSFTVTKCVTLELELSGWVDRIIAYGGAGVLTKTGISEKLSQLRTPAPGTSPVAAAAADVKSGPAAAAAVVLPLCKRPGMDVASLSAAVRGFVRSLFAPGTPTSFVLPQFDRILHPKVRMTCREGVARVVSNGYAALHSAVLDPVSGYSIADRAAILTHTPLQIDTLLDLNPIGASVGLAPPATGTATAAAAATAPAPTATTGTAIPLIAATAGAPASSNSAFRPVTSGAGASTLPASGASPQLPRS